MHNVFGGTLNQTQPTFKLAPFAHYNDYRTTCYKCQYTLCLKKGPTFKLSVTLSNLSRFSKFLHCWKAYKIRYTTNTTLPTSPQVCRYTTLGNQKFKFSADIQQIWKKMQTNCILMQTNCILSALILIPLRVLSVYAECIYLLTEYLQYLSIQRHSYLLR